MIRKHLDLDLLQFLQFSEPPFLMRKKLNLFHSETRLRAHFSFMIEKNTYHLTPIIFPYIPRSPSIFLKHKIQLTRTSWLRSHTLNIHGRIPLGTTQSRDRSRMENVGKKKENCRYLILNKNWLLSAT